MLLLTGESARVVGEPPTLWLEAPHELPLSVVPYLLGQDEQGTVFALDLDADSSLEPGGWTATGTDRSAQPRGTISADADGSVHPELAAAASRWASLREVGSVLPDRDAGLFTHALALCNWHRSHPCCPRCGAVTQVVAAGAVRRCPVDGSEHHPRTDPAVIMLVTDLADRALLGHHVGWPVGRYSTLAGFVEPGESAEAAVAREVLEEVGVAVEEVRYVASQPWPFPSSLMLGFTARAATTAIQADGTEIEDAIWVSRAEVARRVAEATLLLPPPVSIAHQLIEGWLGSPLPRSE